MLSYNETPIVPIVNSTTEVAGVSVFLKREDQNHPYVSGNKWWKLKYNLEMAKRENKTLLTFGGAYSNHIYATAAAANELGLKSIGIIRGEPTISLNGTLQFAKAQGMALHYVSRTSYRNKDSDESLDSLRKLFGDFYLIPEGGTNELAVEGIREFGRKLLPSEPDYIVSPVGTGGTLAGLISASNANTRVLGVAALKGGEFLNETVARLARTTDSTWELDTTHHFGGYAKVPENLRAFILQFRQDHGVLLDPIYTSKMMAALFERIELGYFKPGSRILAIHTGGLQGWNGFENPPEL